jgi:hypothetical protein
MKYYLISLNGYGELFRKRINNRALFNYARKDNFNTISSSGRWGYCCLDKTLEKAYYCLFDEEKGFPGEAYIRGWKEISETSVKGKTFFICHFMAQTEGVVIETDVSITEKEMIELLRELSEGEKKFRFFIKDNVPLLVFQKDLPGEEVLFPGNMKGKKFALYLYKRPELEDIKNLIVTSTPILEKHPVNKVRQDLGEMQANLLWLWGMGKPQQPKDITETLKKECLYLSFEKKTLPLAEFFGFRRTEDIKEAQDNSFIWINSSVNIKTNYSVWVKGLERFDIEVLSVIAEEYKEGRCRVLFIFDGFVSPDIEVKNCWVPFLYISENNGIIRFRKRFKDSKRLLNLLLGVSEF